MPTDRLVLYVRISQVDAVDGACAHLGLSSTFVAAIIIPNVNNAPEHAVSILLALKGKMNAALAISIGSAAQLICFVLPVGVVVGWGAGIELSLQYPAIEVIAYLVAVVLVAVATGVGRATWFTGAIFLIAYVLIALGFYTLPVHINVLPANVSNDAIAMLNDREIYNNLHRPDLRWNFNRFVRAHSPPPPSPMPPPPSHPEAAPGLVHPP